MRIFQQKNRATQHYVKPQCNHLAYETCLTSVHLIMVQQVRPQLRVKYFFFSSASLTTELNVCRKSGCSANRIDNDQIFGVHWLKGRFGSGNSTNIFICEKNERNFVSGMLWKTHWFVADVWKLMWNEMSDISMENLTKNGAKLKFQIQLKAHCKCTVRKKTK